ncbi:hypothetical protein COU56_04225, partial [Candidatus Pacearchaeota archaeon CG10_big_fil_rev_8_21_14_0_10_31_9]
MKIKRNLWIWVVIGVIVLVGIIFLSNNLKQQENLMSENQGDTFWMNTELNDISTGETFKISDFEGKPVLLESFAVWCPTC